MGVLLRYSHRRVLDSTSGLPLGGDEAGPLVDLLNGELLHSNRRRHNLLQIAVVAESGRRHLVHHDLLVCFNCFEALQYLAKEI